MSLRPIHDPLALGALLLVALMASPVDADEGQWLPQQVRELDRAHLRELGLELEPEQLWNDVDGGLMASVVSISGCSAGFVSARGLLATNHHCAFGAIQAASSVGHDYLTTGFLARQPAQELEAKDKTARVLRSITDVTDQVRAALAAETDPATRSRLLERQIKTLETQCEQRGAGIRCTVGQFYSGSRFHLFEYLELLDVRLVYAPPSSIGNYGGEIDNWTWPRHTGDFTLMRAYVGPDGQPAPHHPDNVPYQPQRFLQVSPDGVSPGDFVAVLGYPGSTERWAPAAEVERQLEQVLPARVDLYGEWVSILERAGAADPAVKIKVAAALRTLANRLKNARGMMEGINRMGVVAARRSREAAMAKWASEQQERTRDATLPALERLVKERRETFAAEFLLEQAGRAGAALDIALELVRRAKEATKPDLERADKYMDRGRDKLWGEVSRNLRNYDRAVDLALGEAWLRRVAALPPEQRFTSVTAPALARMLASTKVTDPGFVQHTFDTADWTAIAASRDPMIVWARELVAALEASEAREEARAGTMLALGPSYFEMLRAVHRGPLYPDANRTLRFSYATVQGYQPRDGLLAVPQTSLAGQVAKHTGVPPFDLPQAVRDAAAQAKETYWAAPELGDVPVAFLSNADTTGGNSGSPVIDGRGRLVGLNFDRVWENIAGDYAWRPEHSRNIAVDIRYMLWLLDEVEGAEDLLAELGVRDLAAAPPKARVRDEPVVVAPPPEPTPEPSGGNPAAERTSCACGAAGGFRDVFVGLAGLLVLGGWRGSRRAKRRAGL